MKPFDQPKMILARWVYGFLWLVLWPVVIIYFWMRGRKDRRYRQHIGERFGIYQGRTEGSVWIHAVSMGEMRSAGPLVAGLLDRGETVVLTHHTPAGRAEAAKLFGAEIAKGRIFSVYAPLEIGLLYRAFYRAFRPKLGLVMEVEWWPMMIATAPRAGVPLYICNGQYPSKSFKKDMAKRWWRAALPSGFHGALVKSETQAEKFRTVGVQNIHVTGELRFEQPIRQALLDAAAEFAPKLKGRPVLTLASVVDGEDATYIEALKGAELDKPLFIYVPRAPERFDASAELLHEAGFKVARRSEVLDDALADNGSADWDSVDVLLGDSLGEMYFFLALADAAITGGGFTRYGAHNVIEAMALKKPVIVGPEIWTIEYPAFEALEAGVLVQTHTAEALSREIERMLGGDAIDPAAIDAFYTAHAGATAKTLAAIAHHLGETA